MSKTIVFVVLCLSHSAFAALLPSPRIVGGQPAAKGQFPSQVSIRDSRNPNNYNHVCGGVLIGYAEVLTAAHCVNDIPLEKLYVVAGTTALSLATPGFVSVNASQVYKHEFYRPFNYGYDIAFIRLAKSLPANRNDIRPATLLRDMPKEGEDCLVSGWGDVNGTSFSPTIPPDLRFTHVSYISDTHCKQRYAYVQTDGLCAAGNGRIAGPCGNLDAGDPLHCGGLLGLFSWSEGCGPVPGVYTAIPFHLFWISQKMNEGTTVKPTTKGTTKPTTKGTTKTTTKPTTKGTTKATTKPTTKGTTKATTKPTTKGTTKATTKPTTKGTTKVPTKPAPTKGTTKATTNPTTKGTTRPTASPNGSRINSVNCSVVISALIIVFLS